MAITEHPAHANAIYESFALAADHSDIPTLPPSLREVSFYDLEAGLYTKDQMREYARKAVLEERKRWASTEQALGLYAAQADAIRELLDKHAPDTIGNLQTRVARVLA